MTPVYHHLRCLLDRGPMTLDEVDAAVQQLKRERETERELLAIDNALVELDRLTANWPVCLPRNCS